MVDQTGEGVRQYDEFSYGEEEGVTIEPYYPPSVPGENDSEGMDEEPFGYSDEQIFTEFMVNAPVQPESATQREFEEDLLRHRMARERKHLDPREELPQESMEEIIRASHQVYIDPKDAECAAKEKQKRELSTEEEARTVRRDRLALDKRFLGGTLDQAFSFSQKATASGYPKFTSDFKKWMRLKRKEKLLLAKQKTLMVPKPAVDGGP